MAAETTSAQNVETSNRHLIPALQWLQPRAQDRDDAFREQSLRVAISVVIILGLISFMLTIFVFRNEFALISVPSLHVVILAGFIAAAYTVSRGQINRASSLVFATSLIAASGIIMLRGTQASYDVLIAGIPLFMFVVIEAALLMPSNTIIPLSIVTILFYFISVFSISGALIQLPGLDIAQAFIASIVVIVPEGIILYRLRVEFDSRLQAMRASIRRAAIAQQQAEEARARAEESDKAKSQFLANMSHELRTPLNAIIGYDEAMLGGLAGDFTPQQLKLLGHIQYNSRRLLGLINDVLDLSKIASGSLQIFLAPMAPRKVINDTVESLRSLADEKGIYLRLQISDDVPEVVLGDTHKLQQILSNLLSNAIKFTETGGVVLEVGAHDATHWQFQVKDTGIGLPANAESYIFEPFRQVDGSEKRKYKGTGLGLAITKRLVDALGGSLDVKSTLGEGSTFSVKLPRAQIPTPVETVTPTPTQAAPVEQQP